MLIKYKIFFIPLDAQSAINPVSFFRHLKESEFKLGSFWVFKHYIWNTSSMFMGFFSILLCSILNSRFSHVESFLNIHIDIYRFQSINLYSVACLQRIIVFLLFQLLKYVTTIINTQIAFLINQFHQCTVFLWLQSCLNFWDFTYYNLPLIPKKQIR